MEKGHALIGLDDWDRRPGGQPVAPTNNVSMLNPFIP